MRVWVDDEGWVDLDEGSLLAEGGQGRVFGRGERAYKIAFEAHGVLDPAKLGLLARIDSDAVVRPLASIRSAPGAAPVGHVMTRVERAMPWMQLVPRAARLRLGLDRDAALELCARLQTAIASVHAAGVTLVDLSGGNVLVDPRRRAPMIIDLDSAQVAGFAATAITPQIADPLAHGRFGAASDWFAFAVLAFELLLGVHPYRGTHPHVVGLEARMTAGISVLDPTVRVPPVCEDPRGLPPALLRYFGETFANRHRGPAPLGPVAPSSSRRTTRNGAKPIASTDDGAIRGVLVQAQTWWWTDRHVGHGCGHVVGRTAPDAVGLVVVPGTDTIAMLCHADDGALSLHDPTNDTTIDLRAKVSAVRVDAGVITARVGDRVGVIELRAPGGTPWANVRALGRSPAAGTTLWPGCATSRRLGRLRVQTIDVLGSAARDLPELAGARLVDAAAAAGVVQLLVADGHRFDRWVFGVGPDRPIIAVERDVDPLGCAVVRGRDGDVWVRVAAGLAPIRADGSGAHDVGAACLDVGLDRVQSGPHGLLRVAHGDVWVVPSAGSTIHAGRQTGAAAC